MDIVYTKSEKGIIEIKKRQEGLERTSDLFTVVDGAKSVKSMVTLKLVLKDMPVVFGAIARIKAT
jgi:hypothetical protein